MLYSYIRWNRAENPSLLSLLWPMYVNYLVSTRIDEGSITKMIGLDILLMNMTSFALNIWTKFSSQDKNGQSLKNLAWITWRRNSFKFESFCLRDVITKAPLSYRVSVANLMKFANRKYEKSRDIKRKLTLQYSSWARALNNYVNYNLGLKGSQNLRKRAHHISFINCSPQTQPKKQISVRDYNMVLSTLVRFTSWPKKANSSDIPFLKLMKNSLIYVNVF